MKRWWYWAPWKLVNPLWPWFWRGGDEHGRSTIVIQPPLLGAFIFPTSAPCSVCAAGLDDEFHACGEEVYVEGVGIRPVAAAKRKEA